MPALTSTRAVVLGVGRMGRRHLTMLRQAGLEISGICDRLPDALHAAAAEHAIPQHRQFTEARRLLQEAAPECVVVATTAPSHCELTCLAAERGARFILCEKPMATSLAECDRMIEACARSGARLAVNHPMRFLEVYSEPRRRICAGEIGRLASLTFVCGNVGLAMNGSHLFEAFRFCTGEPVSEVTAWLSDEAVPNPRGPEFEDAGGSIRAVTASGRRLYIEAGTDQGHGVRAIYAGREGMIAVDELAGRLTISTRQPQDFELPTTRYATAPRETTLDLPPVDPVQSSRLVLQALLDGHDYPSAEEGRLAVQSLVAAWVSHERGHRPVRLDDPSLPRDRRFRWA